MIRSWTLPLWLRLPSPWGTQLAGTGMKTYGGTVTERSYVNQLPEMVVSDD